MMTAAYLPYIMRDPSTQTYRRGVAQPGSAPPWGGGGRRFKSSRPDQHLVSPLIEATLLRSHAISTEEVIFYTRMARASGAVLWPKTRRGARGIARVVRRHREVPSDHFHAKDEPRAGCRAIRACFLLVTSLCTSKEKSPWLGGGASQIQTTRPQDAQPFTAWMPAFAGMTAMLRERSHPPLAFHNARTARDTITR